MEVIFSKKAKVNPTFTFIGSYVRHHCFISSLCSDCKYYQVNNNFFCEIGVVFSWHFIEMKLIDIPGEGRIIYRCYDNTEETEEIWF